ncbi:MAG: hypothetical protein QF893_14960 [Alphaproteobacteria bacterium]|jgi:hypothetical protein|nr:hypothetical protein [Alphaproteobacteria bacterium]
MTSLARYLGQGLAYLLLGLAIAYFSDSPVYTHFSPEMAQIKLNILHGAKPAGKCRRRTAAELAELAPNMRKPFDCPRGRLPVQLELEIDGEQVFAGALPPTGIAGDGPSRVYRRFTVAPGPHRIAVRMRDTAREDGYDYERATEVTLMPKQNFVVDFKAQAGGIVFR